MSSRGFYLAATALLVGVLSTTTQVRAQNYDALKDCTSLSPLLDDIHNCMDNYLDVMDSNMASITELLTASLSGESLAGLEQSQLAFIDYRRKNCLWYLNFSSPRAEAEQIAKNCLSFMSQSRVRELQSLLVEEEAPSEVVAGYFVYGPNRNSFQQCGSDERYWLEGSASVVSQAQQDYLALATSDFQVLHAVFEGSVNSDAQVPSGHQGSFQLTAVIEVGLPTESDCGLPSSLFATASGLTSGSAELDAELEQEQSDEPIEQEEPQQQLIAYFGAWLVDCTENDGARSCRLAVGLDDGSGDITDTEGQNSIGEFAVIRQKQQATQLELVFLGREIDSPSRIRWSVDAWDFGDIVGTDIRVDEKATRQLVPASPFLRKDLLPLLVDGNDVTVEVLESVDSDSGEFFTATLRGLTGSLAFADDFVREAVQ